MTTEHKSMDSPEYIQTSLAGAMALGLKRGSFYRNAYPGSLNLLMTYADGCRANCGYCGLARQRVAEPDETTFIRVKWPTYELSSITRILSDSSRKDTRGTGRLGRVCVSMITHPRAENDCVEIVRRLSSATTLPVSVLTSPTLLQDRAGFFQRIKLAGADWAGVAIDAATQEIFSAVRGPAVGGLHRWETYWEALTLAVQVFGRNHVSAHFIVGLGETEEELVRAISSAVDFGAQAHLFSFCPEPGSAMGKKQPPSLGHYRRIQLAAYLLNHRQISMNDMRFDNGKIVGYGKTIQEHLGQDLADGKPFMTTGCPDKNGCLACNRPFGNERPGPVLRNYPFLPNKEDIEVIQKEIWHD